MSAVRASLAGIVAGYAAGILAAFGVRAIAGDATIVWNLVSPLRIAAWVLGLAHGVPLVVRSGAGLSSVGPSTPISRLGELLGGKPDVVFSFSILLVPITVLAITGITVALFVRRAEPESQREVLVWSGVAALVHGVALALISWAANVVFAFRGTLTPELGLGAAKGFVVVGLGQRPIVALLLGAAFGGAFAAAGGLSSLRLRSTLDSASRVVLLGWMRGLGVVAGLIAGVLAIGGVVALFTGHAPGWKAIALGGYLLGANAVAAAIVLAHGTSMGIALDAGPFTGWERMDLLHIGVGGRAPIALVFAAIVPIIAGVVAGRFIRRRSTLPPTRIALRFGGLWALTLAVLSLLLRVRVLSSFSVGALQLGGGSVAFDPLVALALGFAWGTVTSFTGARFAPVHHDDLPSVVSSERWTCPKCQMTNADTDVFCVSCGARHASV